MSNESRRKRLTHEALNDIGGGFPVAEIIYGTLATLPGNLVAAARRRWPAGRVKNGARASRR